MTEQECLSKMVAPGQPRKGIWRSGVMQIMVTRACDKACFGCTQGSNLAGKPAMITVEQFEQACLSLEGYFGVVGMFGGNPSCRAGTKVYTTKGIYPIEELEDRTFVVRNLHGQESPALCRLSGRNVPLWRIRLRGGHEYYATAEHEWPALELAYGANPKRKDLPNYNPRKVARPLGKIQTKDLRAGMRLPVLSVSSLGYGHDGTRDDGFLAGWLLGDGWISDRGERKEPQLRKNGQPDRRFGGGRRIRTVGMICNEADVTTGIADKLSERIAAFGSTAVWRAADRCRELSVTHSGIDEWLDRFGIIGKPHGVPSAIWTTASEDFRIGFIDGLFSADGNVEVSAARRYGRVRLTTSHEAMARDVSELLGFYGIKTSVRRRERSGRFPNGKDYGKTYVTFEISVESNASVDRFGKTFRLTHDEKRRRLEEVAGTHSPDVESDNIEIESVELTDLQEDVWDISVGDATHCFQLAHCVTGNCMHPQFERLCNILAEHFPKEQRGVWCNHPRGKGAVMRRTFDPAVSNLNVHQDQAAWDEFASDWPECRSVLKGLDADSRHSPPFVAMLDVIPDEAERWKLISSCDVNRHWSAILCPVPGRGLRAYFCELAGAQAMLHGDAPGWPDLGMEAAPGWWRKPMAEFAEQVRFHCHRCGVPLRRFGQLANGGDYEEVSQTHADIYAPKVKDREVRLVQLDEGPRLAKSTDYIENGALR